MNFPRQNQQRHFNLPVDGQVAGRNILVYRRKTGEEIGFHGRENHTRIDHRHHIARIIQTYGIERIRIVQVGTDNEIGTAAHHSRYHESHTQANHAHAFADGRLAERQPDGIKPKTIDHDKQHLHECKQDKRRNDTPLPHQIKNGNAYDER